MWRRKNLQKAKSLNQRRISHFRRLIPDTWRPGKDNYFFHCLKWSAYSKKKNSNTNPKNERNGANKWSLNSSFYTPSPSLIFFRKPRPSLVFFRSHFGQAHCFPATTELKKSQTFIYGDPSGNCILSLFGLYLISLCNSEMRLLVVVQNF